MLDIKWIRMNADKVQRAARLKGMAFNVQELLAWDSKRRDLLQNTEAMRQERNKASGQIAAHMRAGEKEPAERLKEQVRQLNEELGRAEQELDEAERQYRHLLLLVPNLPADDSPVGVSDADNIEVRRVGAARAFDFPLLDHVELGERLDLFDIPRGVKVGGARSYYLKNAGLLLHRAVQQFAIDMLTDRGFTIMDVPLMVRRDALIGTGFFPLGEDQCYAIPEEQLWLVGTSEVSLVSYYGDEIVDMSKPIRLAGVSPCFRREVGSAGRDVRGLYRVHQFAKVEQVILAPNDAAVSNRLLEEMVGHAESILEALELPYRVMAVCTGDMSQKTFKQYDIETWMPSRGAYGETHSASNLHDFQARRMNIRYRDAEGQLQYCHTLNNTAVATPRILIPLLENHQQADGSIRIPEALRPYMRGLAEIRP
ncbi:serine--tRNA ligase [Paenibacillus apiarius]|uniref:Serine--tRNA ligase n=1 Tax=Paenibacillus apiarius TaxID=46240 RepID=A0ABT4DSU0_9BACL|nr:serine--tRNA ligase [Paenibacillus apiarius]MCY9515766.1 serine--tRNA ligase [Paenibacillus apiarius]MCY9520420.1 serine--tRNA ligase [Paenibacillus apiarius]MCY9554972.1 serine--tRNA ligase [Paenibacillus apiarius]MCY9559074.1 serine--tRNA ligase [Paenibacillus apiarius]MCY9685655.1 serine--tRNA ligase [Paenibacillus apiarius]